MRSNWIPLVLFGIKGFYECLPPPIYAHGHIVLGEKKFCKGSSSTHKSKIIKIDEMKVRYHLLMHIEI